MFYQNYDSKFHLPMYYEENQKNKQVFDTYFSKISRI